MQTPTSLRLTDTYTHVQSVVQKRRDWFKCVKKLLKRMPRESTPQDITDAMNITAPLGQGEYSSVYLGTLNECVYKFPVAVKHMIIKTGRRSQQEAHDASRTLRIAQQEQVKHVIRQVLREEITYLFLNALVFLGVCGNFPLLFDSFLSTKNMHDSVFLMEASDCNFSHYMRDTSVSHTETSLMSAAAQVLFGCVATLLQLDLVNNDLYPKNILVNYTSDAVHKYTVEIDSRVICEFCVRTHGVLIKLADYGICSSPSILDHSHDEGKRYFDELKKAGSFTDFNYAEHILVYEDIPARVRDVVVFLRSLGDSRATRTPETARVRVWCMCALKYLHEVCKRNTSSEVGAKVVAKAVVHILGHAFLQKCGIAKPHMFREPSSTRVPTRCFHVTDSGSVKQNVHNMVEILLESKREQRSLSK